MKPLFSKAFPIAFIPLSLIIMSATTFGLILFNQGQFVNLGLEARAAVVGLGLFSLFFGFAKFLLVIFIFYKSLRKNKNWSFSSIIWFK